LIDSVWRPIAFGVTAGLGQNGLFTPGPQERPLVGPQKSY